MFFIEVVAVIVNLMLGFFESPKLDLYNSSYGPFHSRECHNLGFLIVYIQNLRLVFGWETEGIWTRVHRSCS